MLTPFCLLVTIALQEPARSEEAPRGLKTKTDAATPGYVLIAPLRSSSTYLVDMDGHAVHEWKSDAPPGQAVYLQEDGKLLRTERVENPRFQGGGQGGRIREFDWSGQVTWEYVLSDDTQCLHHDIELLPNGNVLAIVWEARSKDEQIAAGRDPASAREGLWADAVIEIEPVRPVGGKIVWEWHAFDHLVQTRDETKPNFAKSASLRPERLDIAAASSERLSDADRRGERERLRRIGYVGGDEDGPPRSVTPVGQDGPPPGPGRPNGPGGRGGENDWTHVNGLDWRADLDLIVLSSRNLSELWVIDHSTTSAEARTSSGGRHGHGGDFLFRYGNPRTMGASGEQQLFVQHDPSWLANGHLLVFNNGGRGRAESSVDEIDLGLDAESLASPLDLARLAGAKRVWTYTASEIRSGHISGAQRLANGHTLITAGEPGLLREIDQDGTVVWDFLNPQKGDLAPRGGPAGRRPDGPPDGPREGEGVGPGTGPGAGPRGGRGGPEGPYGLFRADHYAPDFPGLRALTARTGEKR